VASAPSFGRPLPRPGAGRIPVTVISGALGAGKTTLIQQLIRTERGRNTAVIVNEFADIGIDSLLLKTVTDNVVLLGNGCLCCRVDSELHEALATLKRQRMSGEVPDFDQVVIETSGLADPLPVMQTLLSDRTLQADFHFRGLVSLADAACLAAGGERPPELQNQLSLADRIVVTKLDLLDERRHADVFAELAARNPSAPVGTASHGQIDADFILAESALQRPAWRAAHAVQAEHARGVTSFGLTLTEPVHWGAFRQFIEALTNLRGPDLLRVKGVVDVQGVRGPIVIQMVQHIAHPPVELQRWPLERRATELVFITRGIPEANIRTLFDAMQAASAISTID